MIFRTKISFSSQDMNFEIAYNNTTPIDILGFYQTRLAAMSTERDFLQPILASDLNIPEGKKTIIDYFENKLQLKVSVRDTTININQVKGVRTKATNLSIEPNRFESGVGFYSISKGFSMSGTIFDTPLVNINCTDDLYISNVAFNGATVIINNRTLTEAEVNHISSEDVLKAICPVSSMEVTIEVANIDLPTIEELMAFISQSMPSKLRNEALINLRNINTEIKHTEDTIKKLNEIMQACSTQQFKVINTTCAGIADFDFMSV
jgi:hypothetical protein